MSNETKWLIERDGKCLAADESTWVAFTDERAKKFDTQEDASRRVVALFLVGGDITENLRGSKITEHMWVSVETSKPADLRRWDDKNGFSPDGRFVTYDAHITEVERVTKERDDLVWQLSDMQIQRNSEFAKYKAEKKIREAAESKLSQLQLSNEEKARKIGLLIRSWRRREIDGISGEDILAILNGDQP